eukprot:9499701-Pyramimonas_sp.AAC.1
MRFLVLWVEIAAVAALRVDCQSFFVGQYCESASWMRKTWGHDNHDAAGSDLDARRLSWASAGAAATHHQRASWASSEMSKARRSWGSRAAVDDDDPNEIDSDAAFSGVPGDADLLEGGQFEVNGVLGHRTPEPDSDGELDVSTGANGAIPEGGGQLVLADGDLGGSGAALLPAAPVDYLTHQVGLGVLAASTSNNVVGTVLRQADQMFYGEPF